MSSTTLNWDKYSCPRCEGKHPKIRLREFKEHITSIEPTITHWGTCPTTGAPILAYPTPEDSSPF